jgi:hypothetical protein
MVIESSDDDTEPEDDIRMALDRFVYQNPTRTLSKASISRTSSIAAIDKAATDFIRKKQPRRNTCLQPFATDFSDSELIKLVKCVCCGIGWTTRKGVAQKMAHIQSCAKKYAFTDDTVNVLIRQEVDKCLAKSQATKGEGNAVDPENILPEAPRTFMEDLVKGAEPKRRARNLEVKTVKSAIETRDVILDRARVILGNYALPNTQDINVRRFQSQGSTSGQVGHGTGSQNQGPATQTFAESSVQQLRSIVRDSSVRKRSTFDTAVMGHDKASMPSTQNFAPSKLADLRHTSRNSLFNFEHDIDSNPPNGLSSPFSRDSSLNPRSPGLVRTFLPSVL